MTASLLLAGTSKDARIGKVSIQEPSGPEREIDTMTQANGEMEDCERERIYRPNFVMKGIHLRRSSMSSLSTSTRMISSPLLSTKRKFGTGRAEAIPIQTPFPEGFAIGLCKSKN